MTKLLKKHYLFTFLILMLQSTFSFGVSQVGNVKVTLIETIKLQEQKVIDFGEIMAEDGTCTLGGSGNLQASAGSNCTGGGQVGEFLISGKADQQISINVEAGDSANGLNFTPVLHSDSQTTLVDGKTVAKIGGSLDIENAEAGDYNLTYVISVNYD